MTLKERMINNYEFRIMNDELKRLRKDIRELHELS